MITFIKKWITAVFIFTTQSIISNAQTTELKYLGMIPPESTPVMFAPGIVSTGEGVHSMISFNPDHTEVMWGPNYFIDNKNVLLLMKLVDEKWIGPETVVFREGFSHDSPFFSYGGNRLYFLSGERNNEGMTSSEKFWFVEKDGDTWTEPKILDEVFNNYSTHWQFSLDKNENLYFGGNKKVGNMEDIYVANFVDGKYTEPMQLPEIINSKNHPEFSPFISPKNDYLVFNRYVDNDENGIYFYLYISFKDKNNQWTIPVDIGSSLNLGRLPSHGRVSRDGKFFFFTITNNEGHMVHWIDFSEIRKLNPN